jgi:hypothetical protein
MKKEQTFGPAGLMEAVSAPVPTDSKSSSPGGSAWFDVVLPYKRSTFPTGQYLNYLESLAF